MSVAVAIASPMGVLPAASSVGGVKVSAVTNCCATRTGPNVTTATSTRLAAIASFCNCCANSLRPAFSCAIFWPSIELEVSSSSRHAQRGSGLSANSRLLNGSCSKEVTDGYSVYVVCSGRGSLPRIKIDHLRDRVLADLAVTVDAAEHHALHFGAVVAGRFVVRAFEGADRACVRRRREELACVLA